MEQIVLNVLINHTWLSVFLEQYYLFREFPCALVFYCLFFLCLNVRLLYGKIDLIMLIWNNLSCTWLRNVNLHISENRMCSLKLQTGKKNHVSYQQTDWPISMRCNAATVKSYFSFWKSYICTIFILYYIFMEHNIVLF